MYLSDKTVVLSQNFYCNREYKPVCLCKLRDAHDTPTFKTEALRLISIVQLVKGRLLRNERQIQHYHAFLRK